MFNVVEHKRIMKLHEDHGALTGVPEPKEGIDTQAFSQHKAVLKKLHRMQHADGVNN